MPPIKDPFEIRRSAIQGRGAFATRRIRRGQRITEYVGEPITHEEADRRYDDDDAKGRHHTFLFILDDDTVLDARHIGNDSRYINHSCNPNCETVIDDGHIWVLALRTIQPDEEIVYDYQFEFEDDYGPDDVRYYTCRCGEENCKGTIIKVPPYLKSTVKKWLAGDDVKRPPKPGSKAALRLREARRKAASKKKAVVARKKAVAATKRDAVARKKAAAAKKKAATAAKKGSAGKKPARNAVKRAA